MTNTKQVIMLMVCAIFIVSGCAPGNAAQERRRINRPVESGVTDPACRIKSIKQYPAEFENVSKVPGREQYAFTQLDANGVYQVYLSKTMHAKDGICITCDVKPGMPKLDRNKPMISWHPSGQYLIVGIEEDKHDNTWMPKDWQRGLLQSGIWLNIWITTVTGDRWYQVTDFKKNPADGGSQYDNR